MIHHNLFFTVIISLTSTTIVYAQDAPAPRQGDPIWLTVIQGMLFMYFILIGLNQVHKNNVEQKSRKRFFSLGVAGMILTIIMAIV